MLFQNYVPIPSSSCQFEYLQFRLCFTRRKHHQCLKIRVFRDKVVSEDMWFPKFRRIVTSSSSETASHPARCESSGTRLLEPKISYNHYPLVLFELYQCMYGQGTLLLLSNLMEYIVCSNKQLKLEIHVTFLAIFTATVFYYTSLKRPSFFTYRSSGNSSQYVLFLLPSCV